MALINISVEKFKELTSSHEVRIVKSPKTDKLFASTDAGNFKAQGNLDTDKPVQFLYDDEADIAEGCFINPNEDNVLITL